MNSSDDKNPDSWHSLSIHDVLKRLRTSTNGHSEIEAGKRLQETGPNILIKRRISSRRLFLSQINKIIIIILLLSVFLSFIM